MSEQRHPVERLATTPVPLVPAEQVRARGRQRAQRSKALLAGAGVLLVGVLGGGGLLLNQVSGSALVVPVVPPPSTAPPTPSPSPSATPSPTPTPSVSVSPTPTATATAEPTPSETVPTGSATDLPASSLVLESALEATFPPTSDYLAMISWVRYSSSRTIPDYNWDPCGTGEPAREGQVQVVSGRYETRFSSGEVVQEGRAFVESVHRFTDAEQAAKVVADYRASIASCRTAGSTSADGYVSTIRNDVIGEDPLVVAEFSVEPAYPWPQYYGVTAVGNVVAVWNYFPGESEDVDGAKKISGLVREGLCRTTGTC